MEINGDYTVMDDHAKYHKCLLIALCDCYDVAVTTVLLRGRLLENIDERIGVPPIWCQTIAETNSSSQFGPGYKVL